ncbi:DUF3237 domain-containing protein [Marinomonas sp. CT5]|uniref:DUF3237 family protein n=1 Tax=Marinomonas sp. CT5 TaxID=2066133 RepID=UPI0017C29874|nr:DUF3237 family protein [Marinomonas sp. CT5]NVK74998.1 DUF3237 family protein [Oceanospirillaceae bacterium]QUX94959.1 DUF3237 domain-containing protein [Marinomonas sp. CT5]
MFKAIPTIALCSLSLFSSFSALAADTNPNRDDRFETKFVYESRVTIDKINRVSVGQSKYGDRGIVWITGGEFEGPSIKGKVISGGGDWQLLRPDGSKELDAKYALETDDGFTILVQNKVTISPAPTKENPKNRYAKSVLSFEAPIGSPYEWMNKSIFLGTLDRAANYNEDPAVIIRVWQLL